MVRKLIYFNALLMVALAAFFLIYPPVRAALDIRDPALQHPGIPKAAWRLFRNLTPRYAAWAKARVAEGRAETLSTSDISGTEWPLFGSVFYLWAVEDLQAAWDAGDHTPKGPPNGFAREAIIAASELVIDPKHASWVKKHWGADYLHREDVFYRMLVMAALTSREKLLHDGAHLDMLRDQVETFSKELDDSRTGLLDDYPGECYPGDVMAALMCIRRADAVLGTDHSGFIKRALRGFNGKRATSHGLPPYSASSGTGLPTSDARGCANAYMCLTAPELWPLQAREWYALFDKFFWQEKLTAAGFREFPRELHHSEWTMDVDAGPVAAGYGVSASAFGLGAARRNGRLDRSYPLAAALLATVGELPNGVLVVPRLLSNLSDAPLLGEAGILWQLTVQPLKGFPIKTGGQVPTYVYIVLGIVFLLGMWLTLQSIWTFLKARRPPAPEVSVPALQYVAWGCMIAGSVAAFCFGHDVIGILLLFLAAMLPIRKRQKRSKGTEKWPAAKNAAATPPAEPIKPPGPANEPQA